MRTSLSPRQWKSWRDVLPIHPAAEFFPLMAPGELKALSEDIKKNGIQTPITVVHERVGEGECLYQLADGRNRLDAIQLAGFNPIAPERRYRVGGRDCGLDLFLGLPEGEIAINYIDPPEDLYAFVSSANIHRRHLSAEQKRDLIAKLIKATPEKSNRQIAKTVNASHHTVGSVRSEMEGRGQIAHVPTRTDTEGRQQPAKRAPTSRAKPANKPKNAPADNNSKARDDIGPNSASEADSLRARNEKLERDNHRLTRENLALRCELEELKAELAKRAPIGPTVLFDDTLVPAI